MLGMESLTNGALMGVRVGLGLGFLNIVTYQFFGTGTIDWASSQTVGVVA
tara:strand:- start:592 stop:741 length:150 start_codon:yes stop_codon:yes gene_type:complete